MDLVQVGRLNGRLAQLSAGFRPGQVGQAALFQVAADFTQQLGTRDMPVVAAGHGRRRVGNNHHGHPAGLSGSVALARWQAEDTPGAVDLAREPLEILLRHRPLAVFQGIGRSLHHRRRSLPAPNLLTPARSWPQAGFR